MIDESETQKLQSALDAIDPSALDYTEWAMVGMALKDAGCSVSMWEDWSRHDPARFHSGECARKWRTFNGGSGAPVGLGTIYKMASDRGWRYSSHSPAGEGHEIGWGDTIGKEKKGGTPDLLPGEQLARYLKALFKPDEYVGYVVDAMQNDKGKWTPATAGDYSRTAGELIKLLRAKPESIGKAISADSEDAAGAWIRINPVDGKGAGNSNITAWRHALIESDEMTMDEQREFYRRMNLPIAALVESGGKSLHAVVRIDAANNREYAERVGYLYAELRKKGFKTDEQNKNPSRLSRMPGVMRAGRMQKLEAINLGPKSFLEWKAQHEQAALPPVQCFDFNLSTHRPMLETPIIGGILRKGHKMIISGDSKAGKSWMLLGLAADLSEGLPWLGVNDPKTGGPLFPCVKSRVLYINLEIQDKSFINRIGRVYDKMGIEHPSGNLFFVNLRGHAQPLDKLAPVIINMAKQVGAGAIIIDPIYKIITGDENNASDMGAFCNLFDQIAQETDAAVIYSHHHAKGLQGMKKAIDRGSGSGVFARDPDAIIDISQLDLDDREIPMDSTIGDTDPAFQISGCLREFRAFKPFNVWFRYPLFVPDEKHELDSAFIQGDPKAHLKQYADPRVTADQVLEEIQRMDADGNGLDRVKACIELQARFKRGDKTIRNLIKELQKQGRIATMAGKLVQVHPEKLNGQD